MPSADRPSGKYVSTAILLGVGVLLWWFAFGYESRNGIGVTKASDAAPAPAEPKPVELKAAVRFTGTQFVIMNNDAFNWSNCKLEINSGIMRGGYELREALIAARSTATVGAMQFAKSDGQRFNPLGIKANSFSIACDTPNGRGYYFGQ